MARTSNNAKVQPETTQAAQAAPHIEAPKKELQIQDVDISSCTSKSQAMRTLSAAGFKNGPIAKYLSEYGGPLNPSKKTIKYQFVRNVLMQKTSAEAS